jgi:hypothetical protein
VIHEELTYSRLGAEGGSMDTILNLLWAAQRLLSATLGVPTTLLVKFLSLSWPARRLSAAEGGGERGHPRIARRIA